MRKALAFLLILALLLSGCTISVSVVPPTDAGVPEVPSPRSLHLQMSNL